MPEPQERLELGPESSGDAGKAKEPQAVVHRKPETPAAPMPTEPRIDVFSLMRLAIDKNQTIPVDTLERLVKLQEHAEDRAAAKEFNDAMARFQEHCPPIAKRSKATITPREKGTSYTYYYAELDEIARTVGPILHPLGLSYGWDCDIAGGMLTSSCTVSHVNGHSITRKFTCPIESPAGMSNQQKHAAALTYAKRQSLVMALGLTTADPDTDGAGGGDSAEVITEEQAHDLKCLAEEVGIDQAKFFQLLGVDAFAKVRKAQYSQAVAMLERRRARHQQGAAS